MEGLKTVPLLALAMILVCTSVVHAANPLVPLVAALGQAAAAHPVVAVAVAVVVVPEAGARLIQQTNTTLTWLGDSNLTPEQARQMQQAINYLRDHKFKDEAAQAQTILNNSQSWLWRKMGRSFGYSPERGAGQDLAVTHPNLVSTSVPFVKSGYIELRGVFDTDHDSTATGLKPGDSEERTRLIAKVIVHELEHLDTQANSLFHSQFIDRFRDKELGPTIKEYSSLRKLGYTDAEIQKLRESNQLGAYNFDKYDKLFQAELDKPKPDIGPAKTEKDPDKDAGSKPESPTLPQGKGDNDGKGPDNLTTKTGATDVGPKPESPKDNLSEGKGKKDGDRSPMNYNPLDDPNLKDKDKPVDTKGAGDLGTAFQEAQGTGGDKKQPSDQTVIPQPKDYGTAGKTPEETTTGDKTLQPVFPPPPSQPSVGPGPVSVPGTTVGRGRGGGSIGTKPAKTPKRKGDDPCPPGLHREASEPEKGCH